MALPKEPRQKMINLMYLVLTALLALNVSSEILNAFKVVDASLVTSNTNLTSGNQLLYASLKAKMEDPGTREKAIIWNEKADKAKKLSADMDAYISQLKIDLKKEAGSKMVTIDGVTKEEYKIDDLEAATRLFGSSEGGKKQGPILEQKLKDYREAMLNVDPEIRKLYANSFPVDISQPTGQDGKPKEFTEAYFHMTPTVAGLTLLSKFQNNVKNAENLVATYCQNQVGAVKFILNKFEPIATANSTYLMPGEELIVTAGVGAFNDASKPVISIGGTPSALNDKGVAEKKFNVSGGGNQKVHVSIAYTKPDGTQDHLEKDVEYTVGTPGGAAVMLDKMNVFYIGVDNPVTIGSPTGWDKTTVSMTGGTISGTGSKRNVRVTAVGPASITVAPQGKGLSFPFRVKRIPDPVFKVASGKVRMTSVEFKNQQFCRAELENFDFDLKFNVVSATVYFSGANFPNVVTSAITGNSLAGLSAFMARCGPGSVVTFDNVKVNGPDGVRGIDGKSIALY
ncbi:MAG: gliding motility protein GldM [Ferruginibacter sp.]